MNKRVFTAFLIWLVLACFWGSILAFSDIIPPSIEKTLPADGSMDVFPSLMIHVWVVDPVLRSNELVSGVDPDSITMWLNGTKLDIVTQILSYDRVWAHSLTLLELEGNVWYYVEVTAKDLAGNTMEPAVIRFQTRERPDIDPPFIDHLSPADRATGIETLPLISCWIVDSGEGLDLDSISCMVNNSPVTFTFGIIPGGIQLFHIPEQVFPNDEWISVTVAAADVNGNQSEKGWIFKTCSAPPESPDLYHPAEGALLNYQIENGKIRFIWQASLPNQTFRLRIKPEDGLISDILDLSPSDYWLFGSMAGYAFELSFDRWYQFSCRDSLMWSIAIIDGIGGGLLSEFSPWSSVLLAPPNAVVLRTPYDESTFTSFEACPLFTWDSFLGAESYLFGIAKFDSSSGMFHDVVTLYVESEVTSLRLNPSLWKSLGPGQFIWAVIARDDKGNYSDFMNYQFVRMAPAIISDPLTFE